MTLIPLDFRVTIVAFSYDVTGQVPYLATVNHHVQHHEVMITVTTLPNAYDTGY